jgi:hypothetical protein
MNPATDPSTTPVYGFRPSKPGLYLGLFHGRDTPNQAMHGWGFDGPAIGPLRYFHTTYARSVNVEFVSPTDAQLFTGIHDTLMDWPSTATCCALTASCMATGRCIGSRLKNAIGHLTPSGKTSERTICASKPNSKNP